MALSKETWYQKLKSWVPSWFYEPDGSSLFEKAHGMGLAHILSTSQQDADDHKAQTFLLDAEGDYLTAHGEERDVARLAGEADTTYRERVRNLSNQSNIPALKRMVDALLIMGQSVFLEAEHPDGHSFFTREAFYDRAGLLWDNYYNTFAILIEKQTHDPYSFYTREHFYGREDFSGASEGVQRIYDLVTDAVNRNKLFGVLYRVVELQ